MKAQANSKRGSIPTAEQEALRQPAFDPIMLLASVMSGGLTAIPEGLENQGLRGGLFRDLAEAGNEEVKRYRDALTKQALSRLKETPSLLKTIVKGMGAAGGRFTGANALSNLIDPNHPTANNLYALANAPAMNVEKMPRLVQLLKRLQAQMDQNLNPEHIP